MPTTPRRGMIYVSVNNFNYGDLMKHIFTVEIEKCPDEEGYTAICAELGIVTEGDTLDQLIERVAEIAPEMIQLYIEDKRSDARVQRKSTRKFTPIFRYTGVLPVQLAC